jgi:hypothetical protein
LNRKSKRKAVAATFLLLFAMLSIFVLLTWLMIKTESVEKEKRERFKYNPDFPIPFIFFFLKIPCAADNAIKTIFLGDAVQ